MNTHLEMMRAVGKVQDVPVIADLDTGYGNAVNVAYVVPRYAAAGVAAVVIEDKPFPKDSSLRVVDARNKSRSPNSRARSRPPNRPAERWSLRGRRR